MFPDISGANATRHSELYLCSLPVKTLSIDMSLVRLWQLCTFPSSSQPPPWRLLHQLKRLPGGINADGSLVHNGAKQVTPSNNRADLYHEFDCGRLWYITQSLSSRWVLVLISPVKLYNPMCAPCNIGVVAYRFVWRNVFWWSFYVLTGWTELNRFDWSVSCFWDLQVNTGSIRVSAHLHLCLFCFMPSSNVVSPVMWCNSAKPGEIAPLTFAALIWIWNNSNLRLVEGK